MLRLARVAVAADNSTILCVINVSDNENYIATYTNKTLSL